MIFLFFRSLGKPDSFRAFVGLHANDSIRSYQNMDGSIPKQVPNIYIGAEQGTGASQRARL